MKLRVRDNVKQNDSYYYWFSANVEDLTADSTSVYIAKSDDGNADEVKIQISELLRSTY